MPHRTGRGTAGVVFHAMNRGARRLVLFESDGGYRAFLRCVALALERVPLQLLAYCLMPNHFHLVVRPTADGQLSTFMKHLLSTHAQRWRALRGTLGQGAVYQGRFRAFPVQTDHHFYVLCRYVERNPLRAGLVRRAEAWPWSSLAGHRLSAFDVPISSWPVPRPPDWVEQVNATPAQSDERRFRESLRRGSPLGSSDWAKGVARTQGISHTLQPRGRPKGKTVGRLL